MSRTDRHTDRPTDSGKAICPLFFEEGHKKGEEFYLYTILKDAYDELYSGQSARDKGTLFHLKNFFNHRSVSSNVKNDFDFLDFCAQGYILLAAVHIMNIRDLDEKPMDMPSDENERQLYLDRVAYEIADSCFLSVVHVSNKAADVSNETEDTYDYCICKQEKPGQTMIYCDNKHCKKGTWFHLECLCMN
ncbi:hypothetical protein FSP39_015314 [Pinctada imbricata]|uniref:Zinc finger PHD-type domain-containing protein n=1 Tax=Pinctada imbricata TaxID=66713 RepID=A0AA89C4L9_PINIB|nr:hypothetical protein FSP39_015314 [Pinctada imbricata]